MPATSIRNAYEAALTTTAVLLSWAAALCLETVAGLHTDVLVLAVALSLTLAGTQRTADTGRRLTALVLLPATAAVSILVGRLIGAHYLLGAAVFTAGMAVPIWIRRYGRAAAKAGTLMTLPFIALLVVPGPALPPKAQSGLVSWAWAALIGVLAVCSVWLVQGLADRYGPWRPDPETQPAAAHRASRLHPRPSTRMALQMAAAIAAAFVLGRLLFDDHWPWAVLTAYVAASGNRGRTDVLRKGIERLIGATAGTLLATGVAAAGVTGRTAVALMFTVLAIALWLRPLNYAYWAAGMTTALSLLLGYFGQDATSLLPTRLAAIAVGAVLTVASAWWLLPVPRRRGPLRNAVRRKGIGPQQPSPEGVPLGGGMPPSGR
ncbi:FUSC family protein [Streptomyces sp. SID13726]|uniref:FUSC family protein n=1 Tax=Streptomyces sp. SID13726 TaxID=2706058 RepID=UPI0013BA0A3F|nr:FUSC family protein [Streptomyces sp. SID13726]NEB03068.1 FUSC family protein [Streptomyces sp. SID13726]